MNCLEFRYLVLTDPYDSALDEHAETCQACTRFRSEIHDMDSDAEKALAIEVPDGLAARILLNQSLSAAPRPQTKWVSYGLAASFAAALVIGLTLFNSSPEVDGTSDIASQSDSSSQGTQSASNLPPNMVKTQVDMEKPMMDKHAHAAPGTNPILAHASHQPHDFHGSEHYPIGDEALEKLMNKFELTASIDDVVYAAICPLDGENAAHLVIRDGSEQYTVMLIPDRSPGAMYTVDDTLWRGYVSPHPAGALAVLAELDDDAALARIREVADKMQSAIYLTADL